MDRITWKKEFSTGIELIDDQHQILIAKINQLIDAYQEPHDTGRLQLLLFDLLHKYHSHFREEVALLLNSEHADQDKHAENCRQFEHQVEALHRLSILTDSSIPVSLIIFLRHWVLDHLMTEEMSLLHSQMGDS